MARELDEISLELIRKFKTYPEFSEFDMMVLHASLTKIHQLYAEVEFKNLLSEKSIEIEEE